jgi:hypothetical protein
MKIRQNVGYVVLMPHSGKNSRFSPIVPVMEKQEDGRYKYEAVTGYGELFKSKQCAEWAASELSESWGTKFHVRKATLVVESEDDS